MARRRTALPARFPPTGTWPAQMRADLAAGFLDYPDTKAFVAAVKAGDAPPPSALRGKGRSREPIWAKVDLERYVSPSTVPGSDPEQREDLKALV